MTKLGEVNSSADLTSSSQTFIPGTIAFFGGTNPPSGWLLCSGLFISKSSYSDLFAAIGHIYNNGVDPNNGTFKLPPPGVFFIGKGTSATAAGTPVNTLGRSFGSINHTHGAGTLAAGSHSHGVGSLKAPSHSHNFSLGIDDHQHSWPSGRQQVKMVNAYADEARWVADGDYTAGLYSQSSVSGSVTGQGDITIGGNSGSTTPSIVSSDGGTAVTSTNNPPFLAVNGIIKF